VPDQLLGKAVRCPGCLCTFNGSPQPDAAEKEAPAPEPAAPPPSPVAVVPSLSLDDTRPPVPQTAAVTPDAPAPKPGPAANEDSAETRPCPHCGERIGRHDERCRHCGEELAEEEERPWDRPYRRPVRRDCEPHRGPLVLVLGIISIVAAPAVLCCYFLGPAVPLLGLCLGIPAWVLGRRDLAQMKQGSMDPEGEGITQGGMICGIIGTIMNGVGALFGIAMLIYIIFVFSVAVKSMPTAPTPAPTPPPVAPPPAPPKGPARGMVSRRLQDYLPRVARADPGSLPTRS
jgi:hypothetical protein